MTDTRQALAAFISAAIPVSTEIDPRGHSWCEAYLDQALELARAALSAQPVAQRAWLEKQLQHDDGELIAAGNPDLEDFQARLKAARAAQAAPAPEPECERSRQINMDRDRLWEENGIPAAAPEPSAQGETEFYWLVEEFANGNSTGRYMLDQVDLTITNDVHAARRYRGMRTALFRSHDMQDKHGGRWQAMHHGFFTADAAPAPEPSAQAVAHPSHQTVREWMPVSEALRLSDLWTAGDLDNCGQWRAAIKVLADEVRALAASPQPAEPSAQGEPVAWRPGDPIYDDAYVRGVAVGFAEDDSRRTTLLRIADRIEALASAPSTPPQAVVEAVPLTDEQIDSLRGLDTAGRVRFYEHDFYVLSNFSAFTLVWKGIRFDTSEAAYHFEKFSDSDGAMADVRAIQWDIRTAPSAHEAFKIAERNRSHRRPDWDDVKVGIMLDILRAKATQHEYVRRKLLATGDRELVEDSWRDDFWGWGPNRDGKNMLGRLWMQVRSELRGIAPKASQEKT